MAQLADPVSQGHQAAREYEQLAHAFLMVREGYTRHAMAAETPEQAFDYVTKAKALQDVESQLLTVIANGRIEEKFQPE